MHAEPQGSQCADRCVFWLTDGLEIVGVGNVCGVWSSADCGLWVSSKLVSLCSVAIECELIVCCNASWRSSFIFASTCSFCRFNGSRLIPVVFHLCITVSALKQLLPSYQFVTGYTRVHYSNWCLCSCKVWIYKICCTHLSIFEHRSGQVKIQHIYTSYIVHCILYYTRIPAFMHLAISRKSITCITVLNL